MSVRIKYAYLKQQTWLYRRNYPKELQGVLGQAMKQSLKTGDARIAKARAAEVNAKYEEVLTKARAGQVVDKPVPVVVTPVSMRRPSARITDDAVTLYVPSTQSLDATALEKLLRKALVDLALADARRIADEYLPALGVRYSSLSIRDPRTQWGSCAPDGRISLSFRLVMAPPMVMRYVVVHELCHLRVAAHDARFWNLVAEHMPDYEVWRGWLREHGATLHLWLSAR